MKKTYKGKDFTAVFTDEGGYFSFTGDFNGGSGACGDKIAEQHPEFKLLADMHLSDAKTGAPMHSWTNIDYWFKEGNRAYFDAAIRHPEQAAAYWAHLESLLKLGAIKNRELNDMLLCISKRDEIRAEIEELWLEDVAAVLEQADEIPTNHGGGYMSPLDDAGDVLPEYEDINDEELARMDALAQHLDCDISDITAARYGDNTFRAEGKDWMVLTDDESDEAQDAEIENYVNDCVLSEIPEQYRNYFDMDAFKKDARMDGRGHSLNRYDGTEYYETSAVDDETYYIYRQ